MTVTAASVTAPVARYARHLHQVVGQNHHVASPLGAWLLLALGAPACSETDRHDLRDVLGMDPAAAAEFAAALLADPHPLVSAAAAAWGGGNGDGGRLAAWLSTLPPQVETGPVPSPTALDDWASRHTGGLIARFPIATDRLPRWLLASVLATKVSWDRPFELAPGAALGAASQWSDSLRQVLRSPVGPEHDHFIAATERASDVAVHGARVRHGLLVVSVIAEAWVPAADVLAVAYEIGSALATGGHLARRSLFDLSLGEAPLWTLTEEQVQTTAPGGREERCVAVLPAWSASSSHDLRDPGLGFATLMHALHPVGPWDARQSVVARYSRVGFEAAAVTATAVALSMRQRRPGVRRTADLRFGHPYAVVAVAAGDRASVWHGLPVFAAWIAEPEDAANSAN